MTCRRRKLRYLLALSATISVLLVVIQHTGPNPPHPRPTGTDSVISDDKNTRRERDVRPSDDLYQPDAALTDLISVERQISELWYYVNTQVSDNKTVERVKEQKNFALNVMEEVINGRYRSRDVTRQLEALSREVQSRIGALQNPRDCGPARKKVYCGAKRDCGFACIIHHVAYCMIVAFATDRTMVLEDAGFLYDPRGFHRSFQPLYGDQCDPLPPADNLSSSMRCLTEGKIQSAECSEVEYLKLDRLVMMADRAEFLPRGVPTFLRALETLHP